MIQDTFGISLCCSGFAELTGNGYLEILEENGAFGLHLKG